MKLSNINKRSNYELAFQIASFFGDNNLQLPVELDRFDVHSDCVANTHMGSSNIARLGFHVIYGDRTWPTSICKSASLPMDARVSGVRRGPKSH